MMLRTVIGMLLAASMAGCSGEYIITIPDAVAAGGKPARVVTRLQRHEFWLFEPPVADAAVTVGVAEGAKRAAYTDKDGYASALAPAPERVGRYAVTFYHQDERGDEAAARGACYVLDKRRLVVAVDWEAIEESMDAREAAAALRELAAGGVQIVYATDELAGSPVKARGWLVDHALPDGPVLSWGYKRKWFRRTGEPIGSLPAARNVLGGLLVAIWDEDDFARAAVEMNMVALKVDDWPALARRILSAAALTGARDFSSITPEAARKALGLED